MQTEEQAPLRVAVHSRYALVRVGLSALVGAHPRRAVVVDLSEGDRQAGHVDVVLFDLAGLDTAEDRADLEHLLGLDLPVVGLARERRRCLSDAARALGVRAVVEEEVSSEHLLTALEGAAGRGTPTEGRPHPAGLTDRELSVLHLVVSGLNNEQIAQELFLSINTVKTYVRTTYKRIGVTSRSQAVVWGLQHGLVPRRGQRHGPEGCGRAGVATGELSATSIG